MQNLDKVNPSVPETYLNIGGGFRLLVGSTFKLIAGALGTGGMTNASKVSIGETWASIASTYTEEARTWERASQLINNAVDTTYFIWSLSTYPWTNPNPWLLVGSSIINQNKP